MAPATSIGSSPAGKDLYIALDRWLYRVPGGLVISNIGACALFAAVSGSSPATVVAIGSILLPAMVKASPGLREHGIYPIARIVVTPADPVVAIRLATRRLEAGSRGLQVAPDVGLLHPEVGEDIRAGRAEPRGPDRGPGPAGAGGPRRRRRRRRPRHDPAGGEAEVDHHHPEEGQDV